MSSLLLVWFWAERDDFRNVSVKDHFFCLLVSLSVKKKTKISTHKKVKSPKSLPIIQ
jgi:hypothetical protein